LNIDCCGNGSNCIIVAFSRQNKYFTKPSDLGGVDLHESQHQNGSYISRIAIATAEIFREEKHRPIMYADNAIQSPTLFLNNALRFGLFPRNNIPKIV
jgi:hypothetical protein